MPFALRMGQPDMEALWQDLSTRKQAGRLGKDEEKFFKKLVKVLGYLSSDPRHNSLSSHEISDLSRKHGLKIFQSYLENNTPGPRRHHGPCGRTASRGQKARSLREDQALLRAGSSKQGRPKTVGRAAEKKVSPELAYQRDAAANASIMRRCLCCRLRVAGGCVVL
jgi:hypothetical protein